MPRRPRPAHRRPPTQQEVVKLATPAKSKQVSKLPVERSSSDESASESELHYDRRTFDDSDGGSGSDESEESDSDESGEFSNDGLPKQDEDEDEDVDVDAPRVSQWVDEDELDALAEEDSEALSSDEEEQGDDDHMQLKSLENDLSSLPLGALVKAQRALGHAERESDSEDEDSGSDPERPSWKSATDKGKGKAKEEGSSRPKKELAKRSSKHAPTEVTSKRPVTRRRTVVEVKKMEPRDPRFLHLAGELDATKFRSQYGFLSELHQTEVKTLRDNLKRARKLLANSPRDLRAEREEEVKRLERAVKRAESSVNRDKREKVEQEAMHAVKREEKERRKQGKGAWFMKTSSKKELLMKARYDALAESGGKRAVKKAIEKKQKKIGQKEKKSRPFAPARRSEGEGASDGKRPRPAHPWGEGRGGGKRRRVE